MATKLDYYDRYWDDYYASDRIKVARWCGGKRPDKQQTIEHRGDIPRKTSTGTAFVKHITDFAAKHGVTLGDVKMQRGYYEWCMLVKTLETEESLAARQAEWDKYKAEYDTLKVSDKEKQKERQNKRAATKKAQVKAEAAAAAAYSASLSENTGSDNFVVVKLTAAQFKKLQEITS